jgi:hypothetical protein
MADFADGLFGGINSVLEIRGKVEALKQQKLWNDIGAETAKALRGEGTTGSDALPAVKDTGGQPTTSPATQPILAGETGGGTSLLDDPDLKSLPTSKSMSAVPKVKPHKKPPTYLPPGAAAAFDATTGMEGAPPARAAVPSGPAAAFDATTGMEAAPGALGWTSAGGIHRLAPDEQGTTFGDMLGGLNFSSSQGIYRDDSAVGQQIANTPQQALPTNQSPPVYLPSILGTPFSPPIDGRRLDSVSNKGNRRLSGVRKGAVQ